MLYPAGHTYTLSSYNNDNCQTTKATAILAASDTKIAASATRVNLIVPRGASFQGAIKTGAGSSSTPTPGAGDGGSGNGGGNGDGSAHPTDSPSSNGGLSTGAKIGIGVAVPVATILASMIVAFFLLRRRQRQRTQRSQNLANNSPEGQAGKPELEGHGGGAVGAQGAVTEKQELDASPIPPYLTTTASELRGSEAITSPRTPELSSETAQPRELEGTGHTAQELDPASAPAVELSAINTTSAFAPNEPRRKQHTVTAHGANEPWNWDYTHYVGNDNPATTDVVEMRNPQAQTAPITTDSSTRPDITQDNDQGTTQPVTESSNLTDEDHKLAQLRERQALLEAQLKHNRELIQQAEFSGNPP